MEKVTKAPEANLVREFINNYVNLKDKRAVIAYLVAMQETS